MWRRIPLAVPPHEVRVQPALVVLRRALAGREECRLWMGVQIKNRGLERGWERFFVSYSVSCELQTRIERCQGPPTGSNSCPQDAIPHAAGGGDDAIPHTAGDNGTNQCG
jgi:hypothetical protein